MKHEINTEKLLRQEERARVLKHADERGLRVANTIQTQHEALAEKLKISLPELQRLLSNPDEWFGFLKSREEEHGQTAISENTPLNPKLKHRQKTSATSGTVFNTTDWDPMFDPRKRG